MKRTYAAAMVALVVGACTDAGPTSVQDSEALFSRPSTERADGGFTYTAIEVPGAASTSASGIGPGGDIVGAYEDAQGVTRGFLLRGGAFTTIEYPGAALTQARGIAPNGDIVGTFRLPGEAPPKFRSFVRSRSGTYREITFPGHENLMAQRILADGTILGCVHGQDFMASMKGMVIGRFGNETADIFASMHNGATPDRRRIVGLYTNQQAGRVEGYIIDDGVFSPLVVPDSEMTMAWDVNPAGDVVGFYRMPGPRFHGFVRTAEGFVTIDVPGATHTFVYGINAAGDLVGEYLSSGTWRGFVARRTD